MPNWHSQGEPHVPHNAPKYWDAVAHMIGNSRFLPTTPTRSAPAPPPEWQPPTVTSHVVTNGLAD